MSPSALQRRALLSGAMLTAARSGVKSQGDELNRPKRMRMRAALLASTALIAAAGPVSAANYDVTDSTSFVTAVASAGNSDTITIKNSFTMATRVDPISTNVTVIGGGNTIDGGGQFRP